MSINDVDNSRLPRRLKTREISSDVGTSSELVNNYSLKLTFKHVEAVRKMADQKPERHTPKKESKL